MESQITPSFPCTNCGLCCRHVDLTAETQFLDRGDGTCRNYDPLSKGCSIYAERPDICRVDRQYFLRYAQQYTWNQYVALNLQACAYLQKQEEQVISLATEAEGQMVQSA